jgi:hypothetical protein
MGIHDGWLNKKDFIYRLNRGTIDIKLRNVMTWNDAKPGGLAGPSGFAVTDGLQLKRTSLNIQFNILDASQVSQCLQQLRCN